MHLKSEECFRNNSLARHKLGNVISTESNLQNVMNGVKQN